LTVDNAVYLMILVW